MPNNKAKGVTITKVKIINRMVMAKVANIPAPPFLEETEIKSGQCILNNPFQKTLIKIVKTNPITKKVDDSIKLFKIVLLVFFQRLLLVLLFIIKVNMELSKRRTSLGFG